MCDNSADRLRGAVVVVHSALSPRLEFMPMSLPRRILLFSGIYLLSQFAIGMILHPLDPLLVFELQTTFSVDTFARIVDGWISRGLLPRYLSHYYLDLIHPLWYASALYYILQWVEQRRAIEGKIARVVVVLPWVAGGCDVLENSMHIVMLVVLKDVTSWGVIVGALAANTKWTLVAFSLLYAGSGIIRRLPRTGVGMPIKDIFSYTNDCKKNIENLSVEDLKQEMATNPDLLLLDIREVQELIDLGTLPGATHCARGMMEFWASPASPYFRDYFQQTRRTVIYCAGGGRSVLATLALQDMGYSNVAHLEPGFGGWKKAGEAIEDFASTSRWMRRPKDQQA